MRFFNLSYCVVSFVYVRADTPDNLESPFGITITPSTVIASRINSSRMIELTRHPLGPAYKAVYHDAVDHFDTQPTKPGNSTNAAVFLESIKSVTKILENQLGHSPIYKSLFVPSIFHPTVRDAAAEGILTEDQLDQPFRLGWAREAICPGYGFLECRNLGRTREECVDGGAVNLIFALEYEKEYLYAWLVEVEFELQTYPAMHSKFCRECGERNSAVSPPLPPKINRIISHSIDSQAHTIPRPSAHTSTNRQSPPSSPLSSKKLYTSTTPTPTAQTSEPSFFPAKHRLRAPQSSASWLARQWAQKQRES